MGLWQKLSQTPASKETDPSRGTLPIDDLRPEHAHDFETQWLKSHITQTAYFGTFIGVIFHGVNLFAIYFLVNNQLYHRVLLGFHLTYLTSVCLFFGFHKFFKPYLPRTILWLQLLTYGGYLFVLWHLTFTVVPVIEIRFVLVWTAYIGLCFFIITLFPISNYSVFGYAAFLWTAQSAMWLLIPGGIRMIIITSFVFFGGALMHVGVFRQVRREARREYQARKKVADLERSRHEKELVLAREIQDSLAPPEELRIGRMRARCMQRKHDKVGGDWVAMRKNTNGDVIITVADATGKGLQAALVVHAVQSLWAEALDYQNFQAEKWLYRVNKALFRLGVNQPHSMTMGIIILSSHELVYWSAGHLPLFAVHQDKNSTELTVTAICAKGNILGIGKEIQLQSARFYFGDLRQLTILLGTDGVFDKGSRHNKREILELVDKIKNKQQKALAEIDTADDKSLVMMRGGNAA